MEKKKKDKALTVDGAKREERALYNEIREIELALADPRDDDGNPLRGEVLRQYRGDLIEELNQKQAARQVLKAFLKENGISRAESRMGRPAVDAYCAAASEEPPPWTETLVEKIAKRVAEILGRNP